MKNTTQTTPNTSVYMSVVQTSILLE